MSKTRAKSRSNRVNEIYYWDELAANLRDKIVSVKKLSKLKK